MSDNPTPKVECVTCDGDGWLYDDERTCPDCDGNGYRPLSRADVLAALGYEEGDPWCWVHHSGVSNLAPGYALCDRFGKNERFCQFRPLLVPVEDADA